MNAISSLRSHWPEYGLEALLLGLFMISASVFGILLFHPDSPAVGFIPSAFLRRALMGIAMGLTAMALVYSPMGQRSGAHLNPSVTLTFWRLGKVRAWDAVFYIAAQFIGAAAAMLLISVVLRMCLDDRNVQFVATLPGRFGFMAAWAAEFGIAMLMMLMVLVVSNRKAVARWTGVFAGALVAAFILVEAPISGMSMNPARTFGSALAANLYHGWWIYFTAPPLAMLAASELYLRFVGVHRIYCAKLNHFNDKRCIFCCRFGELLAPDAAPPAIEQRLPRVTHSTPTTAKLSSQFNETLHFG